MLLLVIYKLLKVIDKLLQLIYMFFLFINSTEDFYKSLLVIYK